MHVRVFCGTPGLTAGMILVHMYIVAGGEAGRAAQEAGQAHRGVQTPPGQTCTQLCSLFHVFNC